MNLLTNARDALNEKYPGYHEDKVIRLLCNQYEDEGRKWIRITVIDHGNGIPERLREKIFEPFFSTKPKDKGTGLGLSISYGIVKDHHGRLTFDTREGAHTNFYLDLPADNGWDL
jgi:signal transduction histidine kinase